MDTDNGLLKRATRAMYEDIIHFGGSVTLNGEPARIVGWMNQFPTVRNESGQSAEFSTQAIERILNNGGEFEA